MLGSDFFQLRHVIHLHRNVNRQPNQHRDH
ncbi:Uncharacterised protein [Vibrio cholerae]|nr:Uncharacterised protein [Vibrio cholerae]CSI57101.1 Uncharacterised protein [Vibrio cholerae]